MWRREKGSELFYCAIEIPKGTCYITIAGPRSESLAATFGAAPIPIMPVGATVWGAASFPPAAAAQLRLEAEDRPGRLTIGAYAHFHPAQRWRRVLPACLQPAAAAPETRGGADAAARSAQAPLSDDLAEIAANCLSAPLTAGDAQTALALLRRLAARPMDRTPGLGALMGALCQQGLPL